MQVPHTEVLEHVSLILKGFDFCPTGEGIDVGNIPYTLPMPNKEVPDKSGSSVASKATTDVPYLLAVKKKVRHNSYIPTSVGSCFM
ncbi:Os05g0124800 [Oryza sativa Japonica Group]|uniref:Os05g0124800 protein n=1 Tax=Oryza sativa subsp. japonica TaxID=39947 RepID=C7J2R6_ORYSJ|nr:Os05g0124800 [Oryza sativa Japonica Group]|eukprot:NP_001174191.1 Os05g0124800 [Oryza sativa Japonica Group]